VLVDTMGAPDLERAGVESLVSRMVDGIIVVPSGQEPDALESIDRNRTPVVLIDRYFEPTALPYVTTNNYEGGFNATKYLIGFGHRDILCIRGVPHSMPARERERGVSRRTARGGSWRSRAARTRRTTSRLYERVRTT